MSTVTTGLHSINLPYTSLQGLGLATIFYPNFYPARSQRLAKGVKVPACRGTNAR
jgi:hypothetical protein